MSGDSDAYAVPSAEGRAQLLVKGSRFLALVLPLADEASARAILARLAAEHPGATHLCWAWRLGHPASARERCNDAGEPAGSAGRPIARALAAAELSDSLCAVVRWFGGTKLGVGGLRRAYGEAARLALAATPRGVRVDSRRMAGSFPYEIEAPLRALLARAQGRILEARYGESVFWRLELPRSRGGDFLRAAQDLARGLTLFADDGEEG